MITTKGQVLAVAALGGFAAILSAILIAALAIGLYKLTEYTLGAHQELSERLRRARTRRKELADFRRQLDTTPFTSHPTQDRRP